MGAQLWIQGLRPRPEDYGDLHVAVRAAGVTDMWAWGYEAGGHTDAPGTRDAGLVWKELTAARTGRS